MKAVDSGFGWFTVVHTSVWFALSLMATLHAWAEESGRFVVVPVDNPRYSGNELFRAFENYDSPRIRELRTRYKLDAVLDDDIFRQNTWYRDGRPHWAYGTPYFIKTTRRDWIEWTPNVITSKVTIQNGRARIFLSSCTPNFRTFQIRGEDGTWRDCEEEMAIPLESHTHLRSVFRTMNRFGVAGPEHRVEIAWQEKGS